jgi:hypothetical protein
VSFAVISEEAFGENSLLIPCSGRSHPYFSIQTACIERLALGNRKFPVNPCSQQQNCGIWA